VDALEIQYPEPIIVIIIATTIINRITRMAKQIERK
jgi:hypothetical protein